MRTRRIQFSSNLVPSSLDETRDRSGHVPVLLQEAIRELAIEKDDVVVDATLGGGGHARAMADMLGSGGTLIGFDLDHDAIDRAVIALEGVRPSIELINSNFRNLGNEIENRGHKQINKALFDLGWSSYQLTVGRGFSLKTDEPLAMTYVKDPTPSTLTAAKIVNEWAEASLADVIFGWGEERYSRRIAKAIVERRMVKPFVVASDLAEIIKAAVPSRYRFGRIHPATKTFQALRIAVNDELGALEQGLRAAWHLLSSGGRIAVITFHSIEDRIVKQMFRQWEDEGRGKRITRKAIPPADEEVTLNPRSRSAQLRVIQKN